jgi:hypothetical protein
MKESMAPANANKFTMDKSASMKMSESEKFAISWTNAVVAVLVGVLVGVKDAEVMRVEVGDEVSVHVTVVDGDDVPVVDTELERGVVADVVAEVVGETESVLLKDVV